MLRVWEDGMSSRPGSLHPLLCVSLFILIVPPPNFVRQNIAAQQSHRDACFALTAWYLVGSPGVLPQSDTEAYLWARRAAEADLVKAMYAVGYFLEVGIGTPSDMKEWVYAPPFDGNHSLTLGSHHSTGQCHGSNALPRKETSARHSGSKQTRIPRSFSPADLDLCCKEAQMVRTRTEGVVKTRIVSSCEVWTSGRINDRFCSWSPLRLHPRLLSVRPVSDRGPSP